MNKNLLSTLLWNKGIGIFILVFHVLNKTILLLTPGENICNVVLEPILSLNNFKLNLSDYFLGQPIKLERWLVSSSASFAVLVSQPHVHSLVSLKGMCISLCSVYYSFLH